LYTLGRNSGTESNDEQDIKLNNKKIKKYS